MALRTGKVPEEAAVTRASSARALMGFYNRKGIFCNLGDTLDSLEEELKRRFIDLRLQCHGAVATFEARRP